MEIDLTGLVLPERIEVEETSKDGRRAKFVMEPLERGFGYTLGNSIRRVLLSSLRGAAVYAFRIEGVVHEHQTIPSVVEDVHQIIQNLKSLVVSLDDDETDRETVLRVSVKKAGAVTAANIKAPGHITIHDENHHILTLQKNRALEMELHVNKGRGFALADQHAVPKDETSLVDLVQIDAIYNPVLRANFTVDETRVGQRTDYDKLTVEVETDGSVDPRSAILYAAKLVIRHLDFMSEFAEDAPAKPKRSTRTPVHKDKARLFGMAVEDLTELTVRTRNSLQTKEITTLRDLVSYSEEEMLSIPNFGKKSLSEVRGFLEEHGLSFAMKLEEHEGRLYLQVKEEAGAGDDN